MTKRAPGRKFAHLDQRIKAAGGTLGDSARGSKRARAEGYRWIDCNGHSSSDLFPFNMHGAPFNPVWIKPGKKLENYTSAYIRKHHPRLRTAEATFTQNKRLGLSTEWEIKDLRPLATDANLAIYFARLKSSAMSAYGDTWHAHVEVKVLSNLGGKLPYALRVLKAAHAAGFTTILLARGKAAKKVQSPYVDYVR